MRSLEELDELLRKMQSEFVVAKIQAANAMLSVDPNNCTADCSPEFDAFLELVNTNRQALSVERVYREEVRQEGLLSARYYARRYRHEDLANYEATDNLVFQASAAGYLQFLERTAPWIVEDE